jgi:hypothetical protein
LVLIFGQVVAFCLGLLQPGFLEAIALVPSKVLAGEWWRLATFPIVPTTLNPLFLLFGLTLFHLMGSALEGHFGTLRYNLFLLVSYLCCLGVALLFGWIGQGQMEVTNGFLYGSVFLAFAWLFPDFELSLFFILPVKVKWLALLTVAGYVWTFSQGLFQFADGGWIICLLVLAANLNLLLFFGRDFWVRLRSGQRRMVQQARVLRTANQPRHVCVVCGANNLTHPDRDFRYCTDCAGTPAYCNEHLQGHLHRLEPPGAV